MAYSCKDDKDEAFATKSKAFNDIVEKPFFPKHGDCSGSHKSIEELASSAATMLMKLSANDPRIGGMLDVDEAVHSMLKGAVIAESLTGENFTGVMLAYHRQAGRLIPVMVLRAGEYAKFMKRTVEDKELREKYETALRNKLYDDANNVKDKIDKLVNMTHVPSVFPIAILLTHDIKGFSLDDMIPYPEEVARKVQEVKKQGVGTEAWSHVTASDKKDGGDGKGS